jgi:murein DD-endopeptidase MepM/ murein hydrolase activator NlpD
LVVAGFATTSAVRLLFVPPDGDQEQSQSVQSDLQVAGRLDSDLADEPAIVRPAPEPITIALTLDRTRSARRYLQDAGLDADAASRWEALFADEAGSPDFEKGHTLTLFRDPESGDLRGLRYNIDERVAISEQTYGQGVFRTSQELIRYVFRPVAISFRVRGDFWRDAKGQALPRAILDTLDYAFRDNHPLSALPRGSSVRLIYQEKVSRDGTTHFATGIQAASISFSGKTLSAFAFRDENGEPRLYDAEGVALGPEALRFPVNFQYISSGFSFHRYHPILHEYRAHQGVDLAARYGTPVKAVADGEVQESGWCGGLGNCVRIRHDGGIVSIYGHLSRIMTAEGRKVRVGELIGLVGSSGLSTGPHLHYAIEKDGEYVNPLDQNLGVHHRVSPRLRELFERFKQEYVAALDRLPPLGGHYAVALPSAQVAGNAVISDHVVSPASTSATTHRAHIQAVSRVESVSRTAPVSGRISVMR